MITIEIALIAVLMASSSLSWALDGSEDSSNLHHESTALEDAERGRSIYHKIGGCHFCHGYDGHLDKRPRLSPKLAHEIARLAPPPANLRDPESLKSQDDDQRFLSIKFGHPSTAMFPKRFLRDEEIMDLIAYLAVLRSQAAGPSRNRP